MYRILYNESTIFDPYGNENEVVTDASMSVEINAAAYLDFTMSRLHPLYDTIAERDGVVTLYWNQKILFQGVIESIDMDIQGNKSISCVSALDYLNDTVVRPYSTIAGEQELTAPSSVDGYFQWLIDQHNDHVLDSGKLFEVGVNQGANLQQNNFIYRSSTSNPTTASEITDQLLDSLGGYLTMRYVEDRRVLDLYSDIHTMNAQIIDFGVNITDFSKTIDTKDQYTALLLKGGSPEFLGGDFENGDFEYWVSHPNTPIATGAVHGGTYSSFFTEGNGEYVNSSFFYAKKGARYKSTVWIKNERSSTIKAYPRYQVYEAGEWVGKTIDGGYDVPNDGEWHEYSFDFMPNLEDYVRIRPRWVFDTVGNDGNKRVYVDDFDFRRVEGDTDVAEDPISVSMVPDGGMQYDANILKTGDVIYDPTAVARYGYKEKVYEDSTITDVDDLLQAGIKELNKSKEPQITLDIKAVDLALFMEGYTHLNVGDAVRVRSAIHDTDEFLMVNSITLDLQDPGQSEYVIGKAYDSLTGQQSGFLRSLNSGINSSLDAVASLDQTTKDQAIQLGAVENVANQAQQTANAAQNTANNAQNTANSNKEAIDAVKDAQTEYDKLLEQMQQGVADATEEIGQVNERIKGMNSEIESTKSDIDSLRSSTETELQNVKQSVSKVQSDVESVSKKAEDLASDLDGTKATVEQVTTDLGEVKTTVSNAATKADQALQVSTSASQTATEAKTTATSAYQDAQSALTQSSTASQTANAVKTELETKYSTTDEIAEQYATKSLVEQTSQSITSTVEATYATKATVEALENIANNAVQTWMGSGVPTLSNKPASDWTTAELKAQHSGDIYYDSDTGYSYRFGSSDGRNYSWSLIKDTDISKAVADAAKAQQTAEGVSDEVTQLKTDIPATYATKTEVKQTTDSIKSTVSEVASTANSALSKATTVEQTANGLQTTVTEQAEKLEGAVTTISQVSQKVDSVSSTITQVQGDVAEAQKDADAATSTANSALSQSSTVQQELTSFKTSVQQTYETKNDALSKQSSLQQSVNNLRTEVSETYTTKTTFEALNDAATKTYQFHSNNNSTGWYKLGKWTGTQQGDICAITIYAGAGQNARADQNREMRVYIKDSYQSTASSNGAFGVTIDRIRNADAAEVQVRATASNTCEVWYKAESTYAMGRYVISIDPDTIWTHSGAYQTSAPTSGTLQTQEYQTYSTKSYVDQTARTVSLGVVEEYKDGQHGSALATQSDITATKNSITQTVSQTYATKDETRQPNMIPNPRFASDTSMWVADSGTVTRKVDSTYGTYGEFKVSNRLYNGNVAGWKNGQTFSYSFLAKASGTGATLHAERAGDVNNGGAYHTITTSWQRFSGTITSNSDTGSFTLRPSNTSLTYSVTDVILVPSDSSSTYATKTEVKQTSDSLTVTISSAVSKAESAATAASNAQNTANNAQSTANAAAGSSTNYIKNGGPNGMSNPIAGWTVSGNVYKRTFPGGQNHVDLGYTTLAHPIVAGRKYRLSLDARVTSGTFSSSDYFVFGLSNGWQSIRAQALTSSWKTYSGVVASTREATQVFMSSYVGSSGSKVVEMRNVSMTDVTETYNAAIDAQNTANTANTNATNANNRVGNLETCIKMTSDGVRVGKIENGNFVGVSALVNSAGSFDILARSGETLTSFDKNGIRLFHNGDAYRVMNVSMDGSTPRVSAGMIKEDSHIPVSGFTASGEYMHVYCGNVMWIHGNMIKTAGVNSMNISVPTIRISNQGGKTIFNNAHIFSGIDPYELEHGSYVKAPISNTENGTRYELSVASLSTNKMGAAAVRTAVNNTEIYGIRLQNPGTYLVLGNINVHTTAAYLRIGVHAFRSGSWVTLDAPMVIEQADSWQNRAYPGSIVECDKNDILVFRSTNTIRSGNHSSMTIIYLGPKLLS